MLTSREAMGLKGVGQTVQNASPFTLVGGATCPSEEQLQGIIDPNDPCQAASAAPLPTVAPAPTVESVQQILSELQGGISPATTPVPTTAGPIPTTAPPGTLLGVSTNVWLIGGAALIAVLLISSSGGRRR